MFKRVPFILATLFLFSFGLSQTRIYVDPSAVGANDGSSWADAYTTFAIYGGDGDSIFVAQGEIFVGGTRNTYFTVNNNVRLFGGFNGESQPKLRNFFNKTIFNADRGVLSDSTDNNYKIMWINSPDVVIDNFIFKNGNGDGGDWTTNQGGAIYSENGGTLTIKNCIFEYNFAVTGGAIANGNNLNLINNIFRFNSASNAGPAFFDGHFAGSPDILNIEGNIFDSNTGNLTIFVQGNNTTTFRFNTIISNTSPTNSDAVQLHSTTIPPKVNFNIIYNNIFNGLSGFSQQVDITSFSNLNNIINGAGGSLGLAPVYIDRDGEDNIVATNDDNLALNRSSSFGLDKSILRLKDLYDIDNDGNSLELLPMDIKGNPRKRDYLDFGAVEAPISPYIVYRNVDDAAPGSLRYALTQFLTDNAGVNSNAFILFDENMIGQTIVLNSNLPLLTLNKIKIDGNIDSDLKPDVTLDGNAKAFHGFHVDAGSTNDILIKGINIINCDYGIWLQNGTATNVQNCFIGTNLAGNSKVGTANNEGIYIESSNNIIGNINLGNLISGNTNAGIYLNSGSGNAIYSNLIGINFNGTASLGNDHGIWIAIPSTGNFIGNTNNRNIISSNTFNGINIVGNGNHVYNNFIGTNKLGTASLANGARGIFISSSFNTIGGTSANYKNIISSNNNDNIRINTTGSNNLIRGNYIGTDTTGTLDLTNNTNGITAFGSANNNIIQENLIRFNTTGIEFLSPSVSNRVIANSIYSNSVSINKQAGAQGGIIAPIITSFNSTDSMLLGTSLSNALIQIYADPFDQAKFFIDSVRADAGGNWNKKINLNVLAADLNYFTVTQTDLTLNTSILSSPLVFASPLFVKNISDINAIGSLRYAIDFANTNPGPDTIKFSPSILNQTIIISSTLVLNSNSTVINGDINNDSLPSITISGNGVLATLLMINSSFNTVQFLNIINAQSNDNGAIAVSGNNNKIYGTYFGTNINASGLDILNQVNLRVIGSNNLIGDTIAKFGNIFARPLNINQGSVLIFNSSTNNKIRNNRFGVGLFNNSLGSISGTISSLYIYGDSNLVGGTHPLAKNIFGNMQYGIILDGATYNTVQKNYFGLNSDGISENGNNIALQIVNSSNYNIIEENIFGSGNAGAKGIWFQTNSFRNSVSNNIIGLNANNTIPTNPLHVGVELSQSDSNMIINNIISGNLIYGIKVTNNSELTEIYNNTIGLDTSKTIAKPNWIGIGLISGNGSKILSNTVSGNGAYGIEILDSLIKIENNKIGVLANGFSPLPNINGGITFTSANAKNDTVRYNIIANHLQYGISIDNDAVNQIYIFNNKIYNNTIAAITKTALSQANISVPVITNFQTGDSLLFGTSSPYANIQIYADNSNQGQLFLGFGAANISGDWSLKVNPNNFNYLTAMQSDAVGNTSIFSTPFAWDRPDAPTNLFAFADNGEIKLKWEKISSPVFKNYNVYYNTSINPITIIDSISFGNVADTTFTITGLNPNVNYYFRVTAEDSNGFISAFSNQEIAINATGFGNAVSFDGVNDFINLGILNPAQVTFEAKIKANSLTAAGLFSNLAYNGSGETGYHFSISPTGFTVSMGSDGAQSWVLTTNAMPLNEWHHVAYTYDGGTLRMYMDGVLQGQVFTGLTANSTAPFSLGSIITGGGYPFNGQMDEVRIWNVERNQTQIQTFMDSIMRGDEPNLLHLYHFDENIDTLAYDATANARNGSLKNGVARVFSTINFNPLLVTNTADSVGPGTLRYAINYANTNPGLDTLTFSNLINNQTINLISALIISDEIYIDGSANQGDNKPHIALRGLISNYGFQIDAVASRSTIKNLSFSSFDTAVLVNADSLSLLGNYFGLNLAGNDTTNMQLKFAIYSNGERNLLIGDSLNLSKNIFANTNYKMLNIENATNLKIVNNYFGLGADGTTELAHAALFIYIYGSTNSLISSNYIVGQSTPNFFDGAVTINNSDGLRIQKNKFGLKTNNQIYPNHMAIFIDAGSSNILIGDTASPSNRNIISGGAIGIGILNTSHHIAIANNYIGTDTLGQQINNTSLKGNVGINSFDNNHHLYILNNIISGHNSQGIILQQNNQFVNIYNNIIGLAADTTTLLGNNLGIDLSRTYGDIHVGAFNKGNIIAASSSMGIRLDRNKRSIIEYNIFGTNKAKNLNAGNSIAIGSFLNPKKNIIRHNIITRSSNSAFNLNDVAADSNFIFSNSIYKNLTGFAYSNGAQNGILPPVITQFQSDSTLVGTAANFALIQIFADSTNQGQLFLDTTRADASGNWAIKVNPNNFPVLTAIQSDFAENTSNFSTALLIVNPLIVTSNSDLNVIGTLRYAINYANTNVGLDTITFSPSILNQTITLGIDLNLTDNAGLVIDGDVDGDNQPSIQLKGINSLFNGMLITSSYNKIKNLVFANFNRAIFINNGANAKKGFNEIYGNYFGLDVTGTDTTGNKIKTRDIFLVSSNHNLIGKNSPNGRNYFAAHTVKVQFNVFLNLSDSNTVTNNYFGLDKNENFISVFNDSTRGIRDFYGIGNVFGGDNTDPLNRNIFVNNFSPFSLWGTQNVVIKGNFLGLMPDGITSTVNNYHISLVSDNASSQNTNTLIGGDLLSDGNLMGSTSAYGLFISKHVVNAKIKNNFIGISNDLSTNYTIKYGIVLGDSVSNFVFEKNTLANFDTLVINDHLNYSTASASSIKNIRFINNSIFNNTKTMVYDFGAQTAELANINYVSQNDTVYGTGLANSFIQLYADDSGNKDQGRYFIDSTYTDGLGNWKIHNPTANKGLNFNYTALIDSMGSTSDFSAPRQAYFIAPTIVTKTIDNIDTIGTLRYAVNYANTNPGLDTITFSPAILGQTILLNSDLTLTDQVHINGDINGDSIPSIQIKASNVGYNGFNLSSSSNKLEFLNLVSFNGSNIAAIHISAGSNNNKIFGSYIGSNLAGTDSTNFSNENGIYIDASANNNFIGDSVYTKLGNLISGNRTTGLWIFSNYNKVFNNFMGTNFDGTAVIGNSNAVILSGSASYNQFGSESVDAGNVISGNMFAFYILGTSSYNNFYGNFIGTDISGTNNIGNTYGFYIQGGSFNQIGNGLESGRNIISGNSTAVRIESINSFNNHVSGNYIGTDITGTLNIANTSGLNLSNSTQFNRITNNIISGNGVAIDLADANTSYNVIANNLIGTQVDFISPLPNGTGIRFNNTTTQDSVINNFIAFNSNDGISFLTADINSIYLFGNKIYNNSGLGINNLAGGQNGLLAPSISQFQADSTLNGTANNFSLIQIFGDNTNQGQTLLDTTRADASGNWSIKINPINFPFLTTLQSDLNGNTSAFSAALYIQNPAAPSGLHAFTTASLLNISWNANSDYRFKHYKIYYSNSPNPTVAVDSTANGDEVSTSFSYAIPADDLNLYIRITAVDSFGRESAFSNEEVVVLANGTGKAVAFDGVDDYLKIGTVIPAHVTIETWIRYTSPTAGGIFSNMGYNGSGENGFILEGSPTGYQISLGEDGNRDVTNAVTSFALNEWHHIAYVYNGTQILFYVNGLLAASTPSTRFITASNDFIVGSLFPSGGFVGAEMDEFRIWDVARSGKNISDNKDSLMRGDETDLIYLYRFDESADSLVYDVTGNNLDAVLRNGASRVLSTYKDNYPLIVTNTSDANTLGTLRYAVNYANSNPGLDSITFSPAIVDQTILLNLNIVISDELIIDGSAGQGDNLPHIELRGSTANGGLELTVAQASGSIIKNLAFTNFLYPIYVGVDSVSILGNYFGSNLTGVDTTNNQNVKSIIANNVNYLIIGDSTNISKNIFANAASNHIDITNADRVYINNNNFGFAPDNLTLNGFAEKHIFLNGLSNSNIRRNSFGGAQGINNNTALYIDGSSYIKVQENYVGLSNNNISSPNDRGIQIISSDHILVGDTLNVSLGNIISSNSHSGVFISVSSSVIIGHNLIGTDTSAAIAMGNQYGLFIQGSADNVLVKHNVLSGNTYAGAHAENSNAIKFINNFIGVAPDMLTTLPNQLGLEMLNVSNLEIKTNLLAANTLTALQLNNVHGSEVIDNIFGSDTTFTATIGNYDAIQINFSSSYNLFKNNIILNSTHNSFWIDGANTDSNFIFKNIIANSANDMSYTNGAQAGITQANITSYLADSTLVGTADIGNLVQIYADNADEGTLFLDTVRADASGNWSYANARSYGLTNFTAMLSDNGYNTSMFSAGFAAITASTKLISSSADSIIFINTAHNSGTSTDSIYFKNNGSAEISISSAVFSINTHYTNILLDSLKILPNDSIRLKLNFTPNTVGNFVDTLTLVSDADNNAAYKIILRGNGINSAPNNFASLGLYNIAEDSIANNTGFDAKDYFNDSENDVLTFNSTVLFGNGKVNASIISDTLHIYTVNDSNGTVFVEISAADPFGGTTYDTLLVTLSPRNDSPTTFSNFANITIPEDSTGIVIPVAGHFVDVDGDVISVSTTELYFRNLISSGANPTNILIDANQDSIGTTYLEIVANDGNGGIVKDTISININPHNDAPIVAIFHANKILTEDTGKVFIGLASTTFTDPENNINSITPTIITGSGKITTLLFNDSISVTTVADSSGFAQLELRAIDSNGAEVRDTLDITINNGNDAPTVTAAAVTSVNQDAAYSYTFTVNDIDVADVLTLSAPTLPAWLSFNTVTGALTGNPTNTEVGNHTVTLRVNDGTVNLDSTFIITVNNVNDVPTVTSAPVTSVNEDAAYSYIFTTTDADAGDPATLSAPTLPLWLTFNTVTGALTGNPTNTEVGNHTVTLRVNDGTVNVDSTFIITVNNVNDAPTVTSSPVTSVNEDAAYSYIFTTTDADGGDPATLSAPTLPLWLTFNTVTGALTGNPTNTEVGNHTVTLRVNDGTVNLDSTFIITVNNVNDVPTVTSAPVTSVNEDVAYSYTFTTIDADGGDPATLSAPTLPLWLTFNTVTGALTGNPTNTEVGNHTVTLRVNDGTVNVDSTFIITVNNVNDAPTVTSSPVTSVNEDAAYSYIFTTTDADGGDPATLSAPTLPLWLTFNTVTGVLSGTPTNADVGTHNVTLRVNDGTVNVDSSFVITVNNINDAPTVTAAAVTSVNQDAAYSYTFTVNDIDVADVLTLSAPTLPAWLSFNTSTGVLSGTPTNTDVGTHNVTLRVNDGTVNVDSSFIITVNNVNDAAVVTSTAITIATEGNIYSYTLTANDIDLGDFLTYSASVIPAWLSFDPLTGILTGIPLNSDVGANIVTLLVNDGTINTSQSFTINVANVNSPAVITSTKITTVLEDALYSYTFTASDIDVGDMITLTAPLLPAWLNFDVNTGILSGTPSNADVMGSNFIILRAHDGTVATDESFTISVSNTNDQSTISSSALTVINEDSLYSYTFAVNDVDNSDILTLSAPVLPAWLSFNAGSGILSGTPTNVNVGLSSVTLRVNDGTIDTDQSFTINVSNTNDASLVTSTGITTVNEDSLYSYTFTVSDVDVGDVLTLSAPTLPAWLSFNTITGALSGTPTNTDVGTHNVTLRVNDGTVNTDQSFVLTVVNTNDMPIISSTALKTINEDNLYSYTINANDIDIGDSLTYSAIGPLAPWLNFNDTTRTLSGIPLNGDVGAFNIILRVKDGLDSIDQTFTLTVINVNDAPIITSSPLNSINEGSLYTYSITATDPEANAIFFSVVSVLPSWLSFDPITGILSGTPIQKDLGFYTIILKAADADSISLQSFNITVNNIKNSSMLITDNILINNQIYYKNGFNFSWSEQTSNGSILARITLLRAGSANPIKLFNSSSLTNISFFKLSDGDYKFSVEAQDSINPLILELGDTVRFTVAGTKAKLNSNGVWSLISPIAEGQKVANIFKGLTVDYYEYDNSIDDYIKVNTSDNASPFKGYWVKVPYGLNSIVNIDTTKQLDTINKQSNIKAGWSLIGSPWNFDVHIDGLEIKTENGFEPIRVASVNNMIDLYDYSSNDLDSSYDYIQLDNIDTIFHAKKGYWIFSDIDREINWKPVQTAAEAINRPKANSISLQISSNNKHDNISFKLSSEITATRFSPSAPKIAGAKNLVLINNKYHNIRLNATSFSEKFEVKILGKKGQEFEFNLSSDDMFVTIQRIGGAAQNIKHGKIQSTNKVTLNKDNETFIVHVSSSPNLDVKTIPASFTVAQNYPNPFNPSTTISFELPYSTQAYETTLEIFNVLGQRVKVIYNGLLNTGVHNYTWLGDNNNKEKVASGIYFYRVTAGTYSQTRKMVLIK